jgi:formiminoglutamase
VVAQQLARGAFVIVLGGGHETAFGHFLGYARGAHAVEILNFDAHPDVRHLKAGRGHSGSPFRQALEHPSGRCRGYRVAGLLPHSTAAAHLAYVVERRGAGVWREDLTAESVAQLFARASSPTYVSFDIDAVDQAHAPGVSAPAAGGMSVDLWLEAAYQAGFCNSVTSCDLVEVNPNYDRDGQTARLAALTIWQVLRGLVARPPASSTQPAATADTPTPVRRTRLPRKR